VVHRPRRAPARDGAGGEVAEAQLIDHLRDRARDLVPELGQVVALARAPTAATLRLDQLDQDHIALDIALDPPVANAPFAALRSMFVTEVNNDVAQIGWRSKGSKAWRQEPVMSFRSAEAVELWAGRTLPSRHNLSAPDMVFRNFTAEK